MLLTKIKTNIYRFNDQFFYGEMVGTYLIALPDKIVLFDIPTYTKEIELHLRSYNKPLHAILSHGSCGIKDGEIWQKNLGLKIYLHALDIHHAWLELKPDSIYQIPPLIDTSIEIIHTPGHSAGSVCLLEKTHNVLFTGDTFGGTKNGAVRDFRKENHQYDDIPRRLHSCNKLLKYNFQSALPFHYEAILKNAKESLRNFIQHSKNSS